MQTWIPDIYVDLVKNFRKFIEMYGNLVNAFLKFSEPVYSWNFTKFHQVHQNPVKFLWFVHLKLSEHERNLVSGNLG